MEREREGRGRGKGRAGKREGKGRVKERIRILKYVIIWSSLAQLSSMGSDEVRPSGLSNLRSRHSAERRGAAKQEKKKTRSWPDIGVLEWATVKQVSVNVW